VLAERLIPNVAVWVPEVVSPDVPPGGVTGESPPPPQAATAAMTIVINFNFRIEFLCVIKSGW
jgi:hypothetical protein